MLIGEGIVLYDQYILSDVCPPRQQMASLPQQFSFCHGSIPVQSGV